MNAFIRGEYRRLRAKGFKATLALHYAKIRDRFTDLENEGICELRTEPEIDCFDADSYCDFENWENQRVAKQAKKDLIERVRNDGYWILCAVYRDNVIDSIGGFIGDDYRDSGYDFDLMRACIDAYECDAAIEANEMAGRATFAGVTP